MKVGSINLSSTPFSKISNCSFPSVISDLSTFSISNLLASSSKKDRSDNLSSSTSKYLAIEPTKDNLSKPFVISILFPPITMESESNTLFARETIISSTKFI